MSASNANVVLPAAAGVLLYKAYKSGSLGNLKNKIFSGGAAPASSSHETAEDPATASAQDTVTTPLGGNSLEAGVPNGSTINVEEAETIHGQSAENIEFDPSVYQYYDDTCAIQSQHLILEQYGIHVSQEELIEIAKTNGWYAEGYGTPMEMVGKLLEYYGIDIHGSQGNNIFNLANELAQGHQVIVGVDAFELISPEETKDWDTIYGEQPNHALVVVGVDTTDPDNVQVIVTDPGTGNRRMAYPAEQFLDAWKDSDCFMVTTDSVPTEPTYPYSPIDSFAGIPVESLERLSDMDFDMADAEGYDRFVDDVLADPAALDDIISSYSDLFDFNADEDA